MTDLFKEIIPSILKTKDYDYSESDYVPYLVNKALSFHIDCLFTVEILNCYPFLDKKLQYDYYFYAIKGYNRPFKKWIKGSEDKNLQIIQSYYNCSLSKAKEIIGLLTNENISLIKTQMDVGGQEKKSTK